MNLFFHQATYAFEYRKVANCSLSRLVARFQIFRRLMKGNFDAYVVWPLAEKFQNWIVDRSTARNFTVFKTLYLQGPHSLRPCISRPCCRHNFNIFNSLIPKIMRKYCLFLAKNRTNFDPSLTFWMVSSAFVQKLPYVSKSYYPNVRGIINGKVGKAAALAKFSETLTLSQSGGQIMSNLWLCLT